MKVSDFMEATPPKGSVFTFDTVEDAIAELKKGINAPWKNVYESALGGKENVSLMISFSLDKEEDWPNKILQNSRYVQLYFENNGTLELTSQDFELPKKFRKTRVKTVKDAVKKINRFISQVDTKEKEKRSKSQFECTKVSDFMEARPPVVVVPDEFLVGRHDLKGHDVKVKIYMNRGDVGHAFIIDGNPSPIKTFDNTPRGWKNGVKKALNLSMSLDKKFNAWVRKKFPEAKVSKERAHKLSRNPPREKKSKSQFECVMLNRFLDERERARWLSMMS